MPWDRCADPGTPPFSWALERSADHAGVRLCGLKGTVPALTLLSVHFFTRTSRPINYQTLRYVNAQEYSTAQ
ncbi:hypothetical protein NDU88_002806 [Pleurodeles waltl]|uniref:Uncharacterized protein n=1 Tax=Pleurodeles waltl TaxID=8319 RepID=A0AAV7M3K1_PLEWA|nr:hypothetical protein NDU88_002806 [Pleurodeles waltl]